MQLRYDTNQDVLYQDHSGAVWAGTLNGGLVRLDADHQLTVYQHHPDVPDSLGDNNIGSIIQDSQGQIWIGTYKGLDRLRQSGFDFDHIVHDPGDQNTLSQGRVVSLFEDSSGTLWVGTWDGGVNRFRIDGGGLHTFNRSLLPDVRVVTFAADATSVWIGTRKGVVRTGHAGDSTLPVDLDIPEVIRVLGFDHQGQLWVGTFSGLYRQLSDGSLVYYSADPNSVDAIAHPKINTLYLASDDQFWVGTQAGLHRYDSQQDTFERWPKSLSEPWRYGAVDAVLLDGSGRLWVGTDWGILLQLADGTLKHLLHDPNDPESLSHNSVVSLHESSDGTLWIATSGGLNRLISRADGHISFERFYRRDGFDSDVFGAILEDNTGKLWLSTTRGISRFDPAAGQVRNFDRSLGALVGGYYIGSAQKGPDGTLYFGDQNGMTVVRPWDLIFDKGVSPLVWTDLLVNGVRIEVDKSSHLSQSITFQDHLILRPEDQEVAFEFAGLSFTAPGQIRYRYRLDGFHNDWLETDPNHRRITLTNLDPGDYVLRLAASGPDRVWGSAGISLAITVLPPWWMTWWARLFFLTFVLGLIGSLHRMRTRRLKATATLLESEVETRTKQLKSAYYDMRVLNEIGQEIGANLDPAAIAKSVYEHAKRILPADLIGIGLYEPENELIRYELVIERGKRYEPYTRDTRDPNQLPVWCLNHREPIFINDIDVDVKQYIDSFQEDMELDGLLENGEHPRKLHSMMYLPLISKERLLGVITVQSYDRNAYEPRHLDMLGMVAGYTAGAVQNAQVLQLISQSEQQLEIKHTELQQAYRQVELASHTDPLTGLHNRRYLQEHIEAELSLIDRLHNKSKSKVTDDVDLLCLLIDIDHFKKVNDVYGHTAGDRMLVQFAELLLQFFRGSDFVVRWGGEEFLIVARSTHREYGASIADRLLKTVAEQDFDVGAGNQVRCTCSIGFTAYPFSLTRTSAVPWDDVIGIADRALYAAKRSGRDCWVSISAGTQLPSKVSLDRLIEDASQLDQAGVIEVQFSRGQASSIVWD